MLELLGITALFVGPILALVVPLVVALFLMMRHREKLADVEVRKLEARARLLEAEARAALPDYVDAADPQAVANYKRAAQEVQARANKAL